MVHISANNVKGPMTSPTIGVVLICDGKIINLNENVLLLG